MKCRKDRGGWNEKEEDGGRREGPLDCWIGVVDRTVAVGDRERIRHVGVHTRVPVCRCTHACACMVVCSARMSVMLA